MRSSPEGTGIWPRFSRTCCSPIIVIEDGAAKSQVSVCKPVILWEFAMVASELISDGRRFLGTQTNPGDARTVPNQSNTPAVHFPDQKGFSPWSLGLARNASGPIDAHHLFPCQLGRHLWTFDFVAQLLIE